MSFTTRQVVEAFAEAQRLGDPRRGNGAVNGERFGPTEGYQPRELYRTRVEESESEASRAWRERYARGETDSDRVRPRGRRGSNEGTEGESARSRAWREARRSA